MKTTSFQACDTGTSLAYHFDTGCVLVVDVIWSKCAAVKRNATKKVINVDTERSRQKEHEGFSERRLQSDCYPRRRTKQDVLDASVARATARTCPI
ncbi:hypothetical protein HQO27_07125 [Rhodococcus fascians]|nr:hypothetical protein [Rhodococcus fascians]MBY4430535.1 hypothetical protein [Rhodococcus fascians]